jgi:lysophospholipase L1-like esterase
MEPGPLRTRATTLLFVLLTLAYPLAQGSDWEPEIRQFENQDRKKPPPQHEIVFVGSSSIVFWNLPQYFPNLKTINRGFGGSELADSVRYAERIVTPYKPRIVVLYAGDNDIASGTPPERVAGNFEQFVQKVQGPLPQTRIIVISIKPSLLRWSVFDKMRSANAMIRAYCSKRPGLTYVDVEPLMLGANGKPRPELFVGDGLHMTPEGYKIWTAALLPHLK